MSKTIQKLDDLLINQIAAGEVVENPASAIKELVENSIDAGADFIEILIKGGGFLSFSITDNGSGIPEEEVLTAFERHTTSKLQKLEDFLVHQKMGFRGEALASIASCSKITLKTSQEDGNGVLVELVAQTCIKKEKISLKKGTFIEIKDLFFNTPARKKFQKSTASSTTEIIRLIQTLSFCHPHISFKLSSENGSLLDLSIEKGLDFKKAFQKKIFLFFQQAADKGRFLSSHDPLVNIEAFIAPFDEHQPNRKNQFFIVNGRAIESQSLSFALNDALKSFIPEKRFVQGVFHLTIDPKWIDVNIHPQKKEIKFAEESYVKQALRALVSPQIQYEQKQPATTWNANFYTSFKPLDTPKQQEHPTFLEKPIFYIKTLGFYPPYLLINASELESFEKKEGIVFFNVKKASLFRSKMHFLEKSSISVQALLIPYPIHLPNIDHEEKRQMLLFFQKLGFEITDGSELIAHPSDLELLDAKKMLFELIDQYLKKEDEDKIVDSFFDTLYQFKKINYEDAIKTLTFWSDKPTFHTFCALLNNQAISGLFYD